MLYYAFKNNYTMDKKIVPLVPSAFFFLDVSDAKNFFNTIFKAHYLNVTKFYDEKLNSACVKSYYDPRVECTYFSCNCDAGKCGKLLDSMYVLVDCLKRDSQLVEQTIIWCKTVEDLNFIDDKICDQIERIHQLYDIIRSFGHVVDEPVLIDDNEFFGCLFVESFDTFVVYESDYESFERSMHVSEVVPYKAPEPELKVTEIIVIDVKDRSDAWARGEDYDPEKLRVVTVGNTFAVLPWEGDAVVELSEF